ncbi:Hypothetical protein GLP15_35 [Giardia lamblia P15]|uniref:DinF protein n=1 Tax=Giardia intestinalis (strain P15) TaxID=658858 RepID=E1F0P9_GIAIA|nr:Hypothetical protein GLP15_35 [Giardia lamblia P15]
MSEDDISATTYSHEQSSIGNAAEENNNAPTHNDTVYEITDHGLNRNVHQALWGLGLSMHICGVLVCVWHIIDTVMILHLYGREQFYVESAIFLFGFPLYRGIPTVISYISSHFIKHAIVHQRYTDSSIYYAHTLFLCGILAILISLFSPLAPQLSSLIDGGGHLIQRELGSSAMLLSAVLVPLLSLFTHAVDPIMMIQGRHFLMAVKNLVLFSLSIVLLGLFNLFLYAHTQPTDLSRLLLYPLLAYCLSAVVVAVWMSLLLGRVNLYGIVYNNNLRLKVRHLVPINFKILGTLLLRALPSIANLTLQSLSILLIYRAYGTCYPDYEAMVNGKVALSLFLRASIATTFSAASFEVVVSYLVQIAYYARRYNRARSVTLWGALYATLLNALICITIFFTAKPALRKVILLPQANVIDPEYSTLNSEEFYAEITRYLKLSALFHLPSGLYAAVLGAMQGSNYGAGALTMTLGKSVTVLASFIVLMYLQGAGGIYVLAFGFGEATAFLLASVGLILQVKRFTLFSRADTMTDLTISKVECARKQMRPLSTKNQRSSSEGNRRSKPQVVIKEKKAKGQVKVQKRNRPDNNYSKGNRHTNNSVINSEKSLLHENPTESSCSTTRTNALEPSSKMDAEHFSIEYLSSSTSNTSKRPLTQAVLRHDHQSVTKVRLNTNLHICEARATSNDQLSDENSHSVGHEKKDSAVNKSEASISNDLQPAPEKMHYSPEHTQSYETPVVHMNFFQVEASDD